MKNLNYIFLLLIVVSGKAQQLKFEKPKSIANDKFLLHKTGEAKYGMIKFSIEKNGVEILSDSIYNHPTIKFELFNFNIDKNLDFRIRYDLDYAKSNIRAAYISDYKTNKLIKVDDYFNEAIHLKGNYFYRYNEGSLITTGGITLTDDESCINLNWLCHLYRMKDLNFYPIGEIEAEGCENHHTINIKDIKIRKVIGDYDANKFIEKIKYSKKFINKKTRLKHIKKYWIKNLDKFK